MDWLFPKDPCSSIAHDEAEHLRFANALLNAVSTEVDLPGMNLTSARWLWDAKGAPAFVFHQVKVGDSLLWRAKGVTAKDLSFLLAAFITHAAGLGMGVAVLLLIRRYVLPALRTELQRVVLFNSSSLRLLHSPEHASWALGTTMVHWPMRGVLIRWGKRHNPAGVHSMSFQARVWPDATAEEGEMTIVKTKRIAAINMPFYPDLPDQLCFLFVVDANKDVRPMRNFYFPSVFNRALAGQGFWQADEEQAPLEADRPYQFQAIAYDIDDRIVEVSAWSRPTMIQRRRRFSELPLLLWQAFAGFQSSSLTNFMSEHTVVLPKEPTMLITLKNLRLCISADAPSLKGAPPAPVGRKPKAYQVQLYFSISGGSMKATAAVPLPSQDERRQQRKRWAWSKELPEGLPDKGFKQSEFIPLEKIPGQLSLEVGNDLRKKVKIEIIVTSQDGEETAAAEWRGTWHHLLEVLFYSKPRASQSHSLYEAQLVMRSGLIPAAVLTTTVKIGNTFLTSTSRPEPGISEQYPDLFASVRPGSTIFWGESVELKWKVPQHVEKEAELNIQIVSANIDPAQTQSDSWRNLEGVQLNDEPHDLGMVKLTTGHRRLTLCFKCDALAQCYLQVVPRGSKHPVCCSPRFLVSRPVLMQDLELCYAGFCARNCLIMEQMDFTRLKELGVHSAERVFHMLQGFRAALPVAEEQEVVSEAKKKYPSSIVLIQNAPSGTVTSEVPVQILNPTNSKDDKLDPKADTEGDASVPLLEGGADDEQLRALVPQQMCIQLPSNVFWRHGGTWSQDVLLGYKFLPAAAGRLHGIAGKGTRVVLTTLLFYASLVAPVLFLLAFAVYYDGIQASVRSDLLHRQGMHFYLLDFIASPSSYRFFKLEPQMQIIQGLAVLYLFFVGLTVSESMVLRSRWGLRRFDLFFSYADSAIKWVTYLQVAILVLLASNALMWVLLGALIKPEVLIPYAIMVGAAVTLSHSMLSKFTVMKNYCQKRVTDLLKKSLFAVFKVMASDEQMARTAEEHKKAFEKLKQDVQRILPKQEEPQRLEMVNLVRSAREGEETEKFLRQLELLQAPEARPHQDQSGESSESARKVRHLSKSLDLHPDTVRVILQCFDNVVTLKRLSESAANHSSSASTLASLIADAREDCLFSHFLPRAHGKELADSAEPSVLALLLLLQNEEMEKMDSIMASCLSDCLDWRHISEQAENFLTHTMQRVVINAVEHEISPVAQKGAVARMERIAYKLAYSNFDAKYREDPLQIFVDCQLLDSEELMIEQVRFVLQREIDSQLHGVELSPKKLIQAVRSSCLLEEKVSLGMDSEPKAFFSYNMLLDVLEALGWGKDELQNTWLRERWQELTHGANLFEYSCVEEVAVMVLNVSHKGLWQAAAKAMLLHIGIAGYAGCQGETVKAGELAKELAKIDIQNLTLVNAKSEWPKDVEGFWQAAATQESPKSPRFLAPGSVMELLEALVYVPVLKDEDNFPTDLSPLAPLATSVQDLAWQKRPDGSIWHVRPSGPRRLRGLWLEIVNALFDRMDCLPSDVDLFFQCQEWAARCQHVPAPGEAGSLSFMTKHSALKTWLKSVHLAHQKNCTFSQFKVIVQNMLKCYIPDKALRDEVFLQCPVIPDDDQGELRALADLGASLYAYMGTGLWSEALSQVARQILPTGPVRTYSLANLQNEFDSMDASKRGVLEPSQAIDLLQTLSTPGLTCKDFAAVLEDELGLKVPEPELRKYFAVMDTSNDGVLQDEEFMQAILFLMLDFFPHYILTHLRLTFWHVVFFVFLVLLTVGIVFLLVTLVVNLFKTGASKADSAIHSTFVTIFGLASKRRHWIR
ncbi:unnamed protein product [Effrenium voratum]|uniref:EF-hand domain-containing protein n=1 Tax=Effrenium voratum TaxID=2562239 RepID=A0AA36I367_9DINO|nr:unnamed protein product [Effrenium voratum]